MLPINSSLNVQVLKIGDQYHPLLWLLSDFAMVFVVKNICLQLKRVSEFISITDSQNRVEYTPCALKGCVCLFWT